MIGVAYNGLMVEVGVIEDQWNVFAVESCSMDSRGGYQIKFRAIAPTLESQEAEAARRRECLRDLRNDPTIIFDDGKLLRYESIGFATDRGDILNYSYFYRRGDQLVALIQNSDGTFSVFEEAVCFQ